MPTSASLKFACGFLGSLTGITINPKAKTTLGKTVRCSAAGAGWQVYDATQAPLSIAGAATTTLNLFTGLTNPLNEAIGTVPFTKVFGFLVHHDDASQAVNGIEAFGGVSGNLFQGPWSAAAKATLLPGEWVAFGRAANLTGGWGVDATHKNVDLKNLAAALVATVNVFVLGKTT